MGTNAVGVFDAVLRNARFSNSDAGERVSQNELASALRVLVFPANQSIDPDDYRYAKRYLRSAEFVKHGTDGAKDLARRFETAFAGRWPSVINAQLARAPQFEPGKLYSISRANMPTPPAGHAWDLRGLDSSRPGHVFATLVRN